MINLEIVHDLLIEDIGVIPTNKDKSPKLKKGHNFLYERIPVDQIDKYFSSAHGMAIVGGAVSDGIMCIDFDDHDGKHDIKSIILDYSRNPFVRSLIDANKLFIQQTPSGGYHMVCRYPADKYHGSMKLAKWKDNETMIETREEGGYFVTFPTEGYRIVHNSYMGLLSVDRDDAELLIEIARSYDLSAPKEEGSAQGHPHDPMDPISYYNYNCGAHARNVMRDGGWTCKEPKDTIQRWVRPGKDAGVSATFGFKENMLYVFSSNAEPFKNGFYYSPFEILTMLEYGGEWKSAQDWVLTKYFNVSDDYIRVGTNYFKKIKKNDRFNLSRESLKVWTKDEIKLDHGNTYLKGLKKYDDFTIEPDNKSHRKVLDNCYNLYKPFPHIPEEGEWKWSKILMEHVFGDQYGVGIRYMQSLYQNPKRILPILVMGSKKRSTGKTTFLNWLNMIFGHNMVTIDPNDITGSFNEIYATSNIIAIEETFIEKKLAIEKIKSLSTGKFITVNKKYVSQYEIPFFGHIIMTTNDLERFVKVDKEEIRFFPRRLSMPKYKNHNIEQDLAKEIPAFLYYLNSLPELDYSDSRSLFTPEEMDNEDLAKVKDESMTGLYKDLFMLIEDFFMNTPIDEFYASALDIKDKWFVSDKAISAHYIRKVLIDEMGLEAKPMRYNEFDIDDSIRYKNGRAYLFKSENFIKKEDAPEDETVPF